MTFIKNNPLYVLWFVLYFFMSVLFLGGTKESLLLCLAIYAVSILIALSPIGEWLLRLTQGARKVKTAQEKELLFPVWEEVYSEAKEEHPKLKLDIFISDSMDVNAFAVGSHTITVTRGALQAFSPDELKGILAHEIAHIVRGDTNATLLSFIGNGIFSILVIFCQIALFVIDLFQGVYSHGRLITLLLRLMLNITIFSIMSIANIMMAVNSRRSETRADEFALNLGYGEGLVSALYLIQKLEMGAQRGFFERLKSSHPHTAYRIGHLEELIEQEA